jgi:hypothetical protein
MSIVLQSERLKVEIAAPGAPPNDRIRFDRAGFVTQVTLDGQHQFCAREPDNLPHPSSGGAGLCSEIRCNEAVAEAALGAQFPKFGVGLLTKDLDGRFVFHHPYPCDPFDVTYTADATSVLFDTAPRPCLGYAARTLKRVAVAGNTLTMTMTVENVGARPLALDEYCHNFVTIDRLPLGEGYYLAMPVAAQDGKAAKGGVALGGRGHGVAVLGYSNEPSFYDLDVAEITAPAPFTWKLTHRDTAASIAETVSLLPSRIIVWAIDHIISPEIICHVDVAPGETVSWTRQWTFEG